MSRATINQTLVETKGQSGEDGSEDKNLVGSEGDNVQREKKTTSVVDVSYLSGVADERKSYYREGPL